MVLPQGNQYYHEVNAKKIFFFFLKNFRFSNNIYYSVRTYPITLQFLPPFLKITLSRLSLYLDPDLITRKCLFLLDITNNLIYHLEEVHIIMDHFLAQACLL